jgi:hypothetical protein
MGTTFVSPILNDTYLPTDGMPINQPQEQNPLAVFSSPAIPDKDISLFDKNSKLLTSDNPSQTITGTFNFGEWLKIDASNKRIIINDGVDDRIIVGDLGSSIYGIKVSASGEDVKTASDEDLRFNTEVMIVDGRFITADNQIIIVNNSIITKVEMVSASPSLSPSASASPSSSASKSESSSVSASNSRSSSASSSRSESASKSPSSSGSKSESASPSASASKSSSASLSPSSSESASNEP